MEAPKASLGQPSSSLHIHSTMREMIVTATPVLHLSVPTPAAIAAGKANEPDRSG